MTIYVIVSQANYEFCGAFDSREKAEAEIARRCEVYGRRPSYYEIQSYVVG